MEVGNKPLFPAPDVNDRATAKALSSTVYLSRLRALMEEANIPNRPTAAQLRCNSMRPRGYADAICAGMPDMLAAFLGGWSLGTARQLYFSVGDEVVLTIRKYLK